MGYKLIIVLKGMQAKDMGQSMKGMVKYAIKLILMLNYQQNTAENVVC